MNDLTLLSTGCGPLNAPGIVITFNDVSISTPLTLCRHHPESVAFSQEAGLILLIFLNLAP